MRNLNFKRVITIFFVFTLLISTVNMPIEAKTDEVINYKENGIYEGINIDSIFVNDEYYGVAIIQYSDSTYNYVIMKSKDDSKWQFFANISENFEVKPASVSLRYLKDYFVVSLSHRNGQVRYISTDGLEWKAQYLNYQDVIYQLNRYWALDSKGIVYVSDDMVNWQQSVNLESSSKVELLAINLAVNNQVVVVSHYAPKWGSTNYLNGLEAFDKDKNKWMPSAGYNGLVGTTLDIVYTNQGFILAYQNDYSYDDPILFYRSTNGINWSLETNKASLIRDINPLLEQDSNVKVLINVLNGQIYQDTLAGKHTPVLVVLNDKVIQFDQDALLVSGRVYVPVRKIFEELGGTVEFNQTTKLLTGKIGDKSISMKLGENKAIVNGQTVFLEAPAQIINDRTLIPARFVAECIGKKVVWDQNNYIVYLQ